MSDETYCMLGLTRKELLEAVEFWKMFRDHPDREGWEVEYEHRQAQKVLAEAQSRLGKASAAVHRIKWGKNI